MRLNLERFYRSESFTISESLQFALWEPQEDDLHLGVVPTTVDAFKTPQRAYFELGWILAR